jgi:PAS domain S-box-containing protein
MSHSASLSDRLALVARLTPNAVVITDAARRITWVNEAFERSTGYRTDEVMGRSPGTFLQFEGTDQAIVQQMREKLDAGLAFKGEILNRSKDGQIYWIELDIQPIREDDGALTGFLALQVDITAAKRTAQALATQQARLSSIIKGTQAGTWEHDLATGEDLIDDIYANMLGYTQAECQAWTQRRFLALLHPDDQEPMMQALHAHYEGRTNEYAAEFRMRHKAGHWIWVQSRGMVSERDAQGRPIRVAGIHLDISARKQAEADVQRNAQLLRGAIDAIDEAFVLYDPDDRLVFCNEKYRRIYATSADMIVPGASFEEIVRCGAERGQYADAIGRVDEWVDERLAAHRAGNTTLIQRIDDGRWLRIVERRMPDGHLVGFRIDITELVHATQAAEAASQAKSDFIATISHELRTPLQSIIGFSELGETFAGTQSHARFQNMFKRINDGGQRMLTLVNALLDVSKIDNTVGSIALLPQDMDALALEVVDELRPLAAKRDLAILMPEPARAVLADVDGFRMQQVVRNVLANAIRFSPVGSHVDVACVDLGAAGVEITVRDHGPGIPADEFESIFEPFVQSTRTRDGSGGTGLGLTICRKIMSAHGGHIDACNAEGGGALMRIHLPPLRLDQAELKAPSS